MNINFLKFISLQIKNERVITDGNGVKHWYSDNDGSQRSSNFFPFTIKNKTRIILNYNLIDYATNGAVYTWRMKNDPNYYSFASRMNERHILHKPKTLDSPYYNSSFYNFDQVIFEKIGNKWQIIKPDGSTQELYVENTNNISDENVRNSNAYKSHFKTHLLEEALEGTNVDNYFWLHIDPKNPNNAEIRYYGFLGKFGNYKGSQSATIKDLYVITQ